ncbi:MAG: cupin domain-containing protein [Sedimentisphaerales bacterium]|jgi:quercetin dioxygenase-like cupin family protein
MSEKKRNSTVLETCLAKPAVLTGLIDYADDSVVSKTIIDKPVGTLTLFAFDARQGLSEHTAPYDAVVQVLDGRALLTIGGKKIPVLAGQLIIMPANVPHSVAAEEKFKMLLTMIRA